MRKTRISIYFLGEIIDVENNIDMILSAIDSLSVREVMIQITNEVVKSDA